MLQLTTTAYTKRAMSLYCNTRLTKIYSDNNYVCHILVLFARRAVTQ